MKREDDCRGRSTDTGDRREGFQLEFRIADYKGSFTDSLDEFRGDLVHPLNVSILPSALSIQFPLYYLLELLLCDVVLLSECYGKGLFDLFQGWVVVRVVLLASFFNVAVVHSSPSRLKIAY